MAKQFDAVWKRILACEGDAFETKTGKPFTYAIVGEDVIPDRTDYPLNRSQFETAFDLLPLAGPGEISNLVRGSAYIWAILHDRRIRKTDW